MIIVKSPREIEKMRQAGRIAALALAAAEALAAPGVTTRELEREMRRVITGYGAKPSFLGYDLGFGGFPSGACISVNEQVIHGLPSNRALAEGDVVSIDVGAFYEGYHGDTAATLPIGRISEAAQALIDATREALYKGIGAARAGGRVGDIGAAVAAHVESRGFSVVRDFVGHGVGAKLHEEPTVPNYAQKSPGPRLTPGMTLAIEPMINEGAYKVETLPDRWTVVTKDRKLSAHFEHTVAITAGDADILTLAG